MGISLSLPARAQHRLGDIYAAHSRHRPPPAPERVTITLSTRRLSQLLKSQQLHVEDFSCADVNAKECVRRLLLRSLRASEDEP